MAMAPESASYALGECVWHDETLRLPEVAGYQEWKGLYRLSNSNAFSMDKNQADSLFKDTPQVGGTAES